jgi:hypothetical protein
VTGVSVIDADAVDEMRIKNKNRTAEAKTIENGFFVFFIYYTPIFNPSLSILVRSGKNHYKFTN